MTPNSELKTGDFFRTRMNTDKREIQILGILGISNFRHLLPVFLCVPYSYIFNSPAMIRCWISEVPSVMDSTRESRQILWMGYSIMYP